MTHAQSRRLLTAGSLALALALATPLAAFADTSLDGQLEANAKTSSAQEQKSIPARPGKRHGGGSTDQASQEAAAPQGSGDAPAQTQPQNESAGKSADAPAKTQPQNESAGKSADAPAKTQPQNENAGKSADAPAKTQPQNENAGKSADAPRGGQGGDATRGKSGNAENSNGFASQNGKQTICHATGSETNPFVIIRISENAIVNGHADHQNDGDIIPSFSYMDQDGVERQFAAQGDQSILRNGCDVAGEDNRGGNGSDRGNRGGDDRTDRERGGNASENGRVTICHATGSSTNPFVIITVSENAVVNGHADHQNDEDIIPSFTFTDQDGAEQEFAAQGDQSILANGCEFTAAAGDGGTDTTPGDGGTDTTPGDGGTDTTPGGDENDVPSGGGTMPGAQSPTPTAEAPTSDAPTTDAPTTDAPTTDAPTTDAPTTDAPTTPIAGEETDAGTAQPGVGEGDAVADENETVADTGSDTAPDAGTTTGVNPVDLGGTTEDAAQAVTVVAQGQAPTAVVQAAGTASPQQLPFTGNRSLGALIALGLGALGAGGLANRFGRKELTAKHAVR